MQFKLSIKLGNAAMETAQDVANALRRVVVKVDGISDPSLLDRGGRITDENGNGVGTWEFTEE
jgi:hypothetical protein